MDKRLEEFPKELLPKFVKYLTTKNSNEKVKTILATYDEYSLIGYIIDWLITDYNYIIHADNDSYCYTYADFSKCTAEQRSYYIGRNIYFIKHCECSTDTINNYYNCLRDVFKVILNPF